MNKKGFTLVELLAVIIILSLLALLASTSVTKVVRDSKTDLYNTQIELIKAAAEAWGADNLYKLPDANTCKFMTLYDLKSYGLLDSDITNPKTGELFSDDMIIKITGELNKYGNTNVVYEIDAGNIKDCESVYPKICTLVDDADKSGTVTIGDKYQCKVKNDMETGFENGYYFYVLSFNDDATTNLIMDRNICEDGTVATSENTCTVLWYEPDLENIYGPVTAMNYLHSATNTWNNIPNIIMNYKDENIVADTKGTTGYVGIETKGITTTVTSYNNTETLRINNLKARMPRYDEVTGVGKCTSGDGSCPLWLSGYLNNSGDVIEEELKNINGIYGYWTLSSYGGGTYLAWSIFYTRHVYHGSDTSIDYGRGVRPVITIPNFNMS